MRPYKLHVNFTVISFADLVSIPFGIHVKHSILNHVQVHHFTALSSMILHSRLNSPGGMGMGYSAVMVTK